MRTDFTHIREHLDSFLGAMEETVASLLGDANDLRQELISLNKRMNENRLDLEEFGEMMGLVGVAFLNLEETCFDVGTKVVDTMTGALDEVPTCDYEDFVGYCSVCGKELTENDHYLCDDCDRNGYVCADCLNDQDTQARIEMDEFVTEAIEDDAE